MHPADTQKHFIAEKQCFEVNRALHPQPVRNGGSSAGTLAAGSTRMTLGLTTNESATCRCATSAGVVYKAMSNAFTTTEATFPRNCGSPACSTAKAKATFSVARTTPATSILTVTPSPSPWPATAPAAARPPAPSTAAPLLSSPEASSKGRHSGIPVVCDRTVGAERPSVMRYWPSHGSGQPLTVLLQFRGCVIAQSC